MWEELEKERAKVRRLLLEAGEITFVSPGLLRGVSSAMSTWNTCHPPASSSSFFFHLQLRTLVMHRANGDHLDAESF